MATKNNGITRADAVAFAMERCVDNPDVIEVLAKLHKQYTTRKKSEGPTKVYTDNVKLARKVANAITEEGVESVDSKWIANNVAGVGTPQKAVAVMRAGISEGIIKKLTIPHGSRNDVRYAVAEQQTPRAWRKTAHALRRFGGWVGIGEK